MPTHLNGMAKLVLSVDIEDWAQSTWDKSLEMPPHAERNAERLLGILEEHRRTATMFVLGKFAERFPSIVKRMASGGHEIASHGHGHVPIFSQTPVEFRKDALRAKDYLEDLTGSPVVGYRAPDFSVIRSTTWALEVLADIGFRYDSSIFPIKNRRYGISDWPSHPVAVRLPSGASIIELPIAVVPLLGRQWPVGGGGYHRLLPWPLIRAAIAHTLRAGKPFVSYCHPYEFDTLELENLDLDLPFKLRLHQGFGRAGFQAKFEHILMGFETMLASPIALGGNWPDHFL